MSTNTITVTIPERLYRRLQLVAEHTNQAVADVLLASAEAMLSIESGDVTLPPELADALTAMRLFSDEALWASTQPTWPPERQTRLSALTEAQKQGVLTPAEQEEWKGLLAEYDASVLRRAQALALLALRGHKLPDLNHTN